MNGKTLIADIARKVLERAERPISARDEQVLADIQNRTASTSAAQDRAALGDTYWDRLADRVAQIGGSWAFIFSFAAILVFWMVLNSEILADWNCLLTLIPSSSSISCSPQSPPFRPLSS